MTYILDVINKILDPIGIVVGLIIAIPVVWTWWEVTFGKKRLHRKWYKQAKNAKQADAVMIIDLLANQEMKSAVSKYLTEQNVDVGSNIFTISRTKNIVTEDLPDIVQELRNKIGEISRLAPAKLLVFYGGPSAFALIVGAELSNKNGDIQIYQMTNGKYHNWGPIRHAQF